MTLRSKTRTLPALTIAAFCGAAAVTGLALTAREAGSAGRVQPEMAPGHPLASMHQIDEQAAMEAWMAASTPGPAHAWLGQFIGTWSTTMTMQMGPDSMVSHGTSTFSWLMEGRFLQQDYQGDMMGMPMTGHGVTGFDNGKRQYVGVWLDSFGTGISSMQGSLDPTGKIQTMIGAMDEPTTGEHGKAVMYVTTVIDANHMKFEAREILYGEPFTVFTIDYVREN